MIKRTITVTVPENIYMQLENEARSRASSVDALVMQTLTRDFPFPAESDLPAPVQAELDAMEHLSDEALWAIARSTANEDKIALYDLLIDRQNDGSLTTQGGTLLGRLRDEADGLMVRKSHAYVILRRRGYRLPTLDELRSQTP